MQPYNPHFLLREELQAEMLQPQATSHAERCSIRQVTLAGISHLLPFNPCEVAIKSCKMVEELLRSAQAAHLEQ